MSVHFAVYPLTCYLGSLSVLMAGTFLALDGPRCRAGRNRWLNQLLCVRPTVFLLINGVKVPLIQILQSQLALVNLLWYLKIIHQYPDWSRSNLQNNDKLFRWSMLPFFFLSFPCQFGLNSQPSNVQTKSKKKKSFFPPHCIFVPVVTVTCLFETRRAWPRSCLPVSLSWL